LFCATANTNLNLAPFALPVSFSKHVSTPPAFTHLFSFRFEGDIEKGGRYGKGKMDCIYCNHRQLDTSYHEMAIGLLA